MNPELTRLQDQYSNISSALNSSSTARPGEQMPTMRDVRTEQQMKKTIEQIEGIKDKELRERWYGSGSQEEKSDTAAPPIGLFQRTVNALTAPLYAGVGALDYATGQSRGSNAFDAMNKNITEDRRLWGDVLKGAGLPGVIAKPVGLVADIVTDPVNILTAGTGGLLARIAIGGSKGFTKGGITGAARGMRYGVESRALETAMVAKALTIGGTRLATKVAAAANPMRFLNKTKKAAPAAEVAANTASKVKSGMESRLITATKKYDEIVGSNAIDRAIADRTLGGYFYQTLEEGMRRAGDKFPAAREYFEKYFVYDNEKWSRVARIKDALLEHSTEPQVNAATKAFVRTHRSGGSIDEAMDAARKEITTTRADFDTPPPKPGGPDPFEEPNSFIPMAKEELDTKIAALANKPEVGADDVIAVQEVADDSVEAMRVLKSPDTYITQDPFETQFRLFAEATGNRDSYNKFAKILGDMIAAGDAGHTGVAWWDNMRAGVNEFRKTVKEKKSLSNPNITIKERVGEKTAQFLDVYDAMMAVFKRSKVAASVRAWTNSILGNIAMAKLNGIDVMDPDYMKSFKQSFNVVTGKSSSELLLNDLANVSDLIPMVRANPSQFELTTGLSRDELVRVEQLKNLVGQFKKIGVEGGALPKTATDSQVLDAMEGLLREAGQAANTTESTMADLAQTWAKKRKESMSTVNSRKLESINPVTGEASGLVGTDLVSNEFFQSEQANRFFKRLADGAKEEGNYVAKLGNLIFNKMPEGYGKIDHVYKLANVVYTSKYGVKEHELRQIARAVKLMPEDVTEVVTDGISRYRLSAAKSFELANETFLNYNAMPAAVKLIRQMPLVGAPFIAFTYGMYGKVMKGLIKNPAFFTKQHYALEEMSADTTPVEKALLAMERYQYLNDPAMIKVNFPGNNMVYVNAANVLPYLSLSLTQPTSRSFEEVLPNSVVQVIDRSPILKDPIGSMIFDYFVLPAMLSEEIPLGAFGQPVYPTDPSLAERVLYPARTIADAFMPGVVEQAVGTIGPSSAAPVMPGYLTRKMLYAKEGKTPIGVQSKEPATSRFSRAFLSGLGVPIQTPVPHTYLQEDEVADKLNQQ